MEKGEIEMDDLKALDELLEIIWGSAPIERKTKKKKPRDSKGRYIKTSRLMEKRR